MTDAPVCHVPGQEPDPDTPSAKLPPIPIATDLPSALSALNAMRQYIMQTSGQIIPSPKGKNIGFKFIPDKKQPKKNQGRWTEAERVHEKVKIKNPDDDTQFIEVERINSLTMKDSQTGESWVWKR